MGTSASSKGPGGGVPMVPPWVPDPAAPVPQPQNADGAAPADGDGQGAPGGQNGPAGQQPSNPNEASQQHSAQALPSPVSPAGRFAGARLNFGKFAQGGNKRYMRRGVRDYVRKGYGSRATAVRRFGGTAATADALYGALSNAAAGQPATPGSAFDPVLLRGRSAREVMDAAIEAVRPTDGTQDAEATRAAVKDALSEVLTLYPEADLLNLTEEQRIAAVERFVAIDVYRRAMLDIGKTIQEKAPTAVTALERRKEVKDYIKQTVAAAFRKLRAAGTSLTKGRVNQVVTAALREAFQVFGG